jgi:hydroxypyruvate reductase
LIVSDVIGDPLDVIASGLTVPDPTTIADASAVLRTRGVWDAVPVSVRQHLDIGDDESPKPGDPCFERVTSAIIGNNRIAAEAACVRAESLGYAASVVTTTLAGEARDAGAQIARDALVRQATRQATLHAADRPLCLIYAGETTVTVTGPGLGGRNQELALAAALELDGHMGITVTSVGTDGIDGPTDAAGASADGTTLPRSRDLDLDAQRALRDNDAYPFWQSLGDLVITGPTGTNVMDLIVVTIRPAV